MERTQPRARNRQFGGEQTIQACARRKRNRKLYFQTYPAWGGSHQLLPDLQVCKLVNSFGLSPEGFQVECLGANPNRVVGLQCFNCGGIDVTNTFALKDGTVPCLAARRAFVDEPRVKLPPIGVESDLIAALKGSKTSATAANDPRLRGDLGGNDPADLKCIAHIVLVFRSEVHQDGARESP